MMRADEVATGSRSIIEIALDFGFDLVACDDLGNLTLFLPLDRDADSALELSPSAG